MEQTIKLFLFDLDGTLASIDSDTLYPDAAEWLNEHKEAVLNSQVFIVTNQGGAGLRWWMEAKGFGDPTKYPTAEDFKARLNRIFSKVSVFPATLMCFRYQSKKSGEWCPVPPGCAGQDEWSTTWRKPEPGMLLHAMSLAGVNHLQTMMVGDSEEDRQAALNAGCNFLWAWEFFGRDKPESE